MALNTNRSPGDPIESSDINLIASTLNSVDARVIRGEGFPTATAPMGTIYVDTLNTCGASMWVRRSSWWSVLHGDTGWRDVASFFDQSRYELTSVGPPHFLMRRVNDQAYFSMRIRLKSIEGLNTGVHNDSIRETLIPTAALGVPPAHPYTGLAVVSVGSILHELGTYANGRDVYVSGAGANSTPYKVGDHITATFSYIAKSGWPTTLPGTAA